MWMIRVLVALVVVVAGGAVVFTILAWRTEIDAVEPPSTADFDNDLISDGARLAALGNCIDCHTAPDGPAYAGGYAMNTPYGVIYGTNITPDPETGIGRWSEVAFIRAMREGVDRQGRHLYPAFPYDQFTRASDDDLRAIYAYLMTRQPVQYEAPSPDVPLPLRFRPLLAGWKLLFHDDRRFQPDPDQSAEWNHGAYLVDGLAHCGGCHTPRSVFGARQEDDAYLAGGESEDWYAPPLNQASPAPIPWDRESLVRYLRIGIEPDHAVAAGPMSPVVRNLAQVPQEDVEAIATYIASVIGSDAVRDTPADINAADAAPNLLVEQGEVLFAGACAICHDDIGPQYFRAQVDLDRATSIEHADPRNLIHVILGGIEQPLAPGEPLMPGFATSLSDGQVAAVIAYLRNRLSDRPMWEDLQDEVSRIREERQDRQTRFGVAAGDRIEEEDE